HRHAHASRLTGPESRHFHPLTAERETMTGPYDVPPGPPPPYDPGGDPPPYQGITSADDHTRALMGYIGQLAVGVIAPIVVYFSRRDQSPFVRFHGAQALNLALTYFVLFLGAIAIGVVGLLAGRPIILVPAFLLIFVFAALHFVFLIVGAVKAGRRE